MSSSLRKLKAIVLGHNTDMESTAAQLQDACIPISTDECRGCPDPCDQGHEEYSSRFDVDMETQMLGSVKPYRRQVGFSSTKLRTVLTGCPAQFVISTGKTDWAHDVTSVSGSLASFLDSTSPSHPSSSDSHLPPASTSYTQLGKTVPGVFSSTGASKTTLLNGSHHSLSDDQDKDTVLVLPDYKVVADVDRSIEGASALWDEIVGDKKATGASDGKQDGHKGQQSYILPYACVILLCKCHARACFYIFRI